MIALIILMLLINPIEYFLGVNLTGLDFFLPFLFFVRKNVITYSTKSIIILIFLLISLLLSYYFSTYYISNLVLLTSVFYYSYPFHLSLISANFRVTDDHLKKIAYIFIFNFVIIRLLMFTNIQRTLLVSIDCGILKTII